MKNLSKNVARLLSVVAGLGLTVSNSVPRAMDNTSMEVVEEKGNERTIIRPISKEEYDSFKQKKKKLYRDGKGNLIDKWMSRVYGKTQWSPRAGKAPIQVFSILKVSDDFGNDIKLHPVLEFVNKNKNTLGLKKVGEHIVDRDNKLLIYDRETENVILTDRAEDIWAAYQNKEQTKDFGPGDFGLPTVNLDEIIALGKWIDKQETEGYKRAEENKQKKIHDEVTNFKPVNVIKNVTLENKTSNTAVAATKSNQETITTSAVSRGDCQKKVEERTDEIKSCAKPIVAWTLGVVGVGGMLWLLPVIFGSPEADAQGETYAQDEMYF